MGADNLSNKMNRSLGELALFGTATEEYVANIAVGISPGASAASSQTLGTVAPLVPKTTGICSFAGNMTVTCSVANTIVTFKMLAGSTVIAQGRASADANELASFTFSFIDPETHPIGTGVNYTITATPASGTVAIAAGEATLWATEL
jgi:hypothetical protein